MPVPACDGILGEVQQPIPGDHVTQYHSALGSPPCESAPNAARVLELLATIRRLAVDQPLLEYRLGELSSLLDEMLG
jgi:hypothetical protein